MGLIRADNQRKILLAILCGVWIATDQITKTFATESFLKWSAADDVTQYLGSKQELILVGDRLAGGQNFFYFGFNYVRNLGSAWGTFASLPSHIRQPFFHALSILALILLGLYYYYAGMEQKWTRFGLACIIGGAMGNYLDRMRLGYVIDFMDCRWRLDGWSYNFPNFNVADVAIAVGFLSLIGETLLWSFRPKGSLPDSLESRK